MAFTAKKTAVQRTHFQLKTTFFGIKLNQMQRVDKV